MTEKTCPIIGMSQVHKIALENEGVTQAVAAGSYVAAWYCLPDFVHNRYLRGAIKTVMTGGLLAYLFHLDSRGLDRTIKKFAGQYYDACPVAKWDPALQVAAVSGAVVLAVHFNNLIERLILRRGERRRLRGHRFAHTRQGLFLGTIAGLSVALDPKHIEAISNSCKDRCKDCATNAS